MLQNFRTFIFCAAAAASGRLCQLTLIASSRRPRRYVEHRKLNYQLIPLAAVDAWSCCCLDTVLLLSASDIGCALKTRKGHSGHLPANELTSSKGSVSQRGLCIYALAAEELAAKLEPSAKERKTEETADGLTCFLCLCPESLNRDFSCICLEFFSAHSLFIFTLLPLRAGQLARQLTLASSAKKQCCCQALTLS